MATYDPRTIAIGVLGKPHGVHGEIGLRLFNLEALAPLEPGPVMLERGGRSTSHTVTQVRPFGAGLLVMFAGVESREAAAALTHSEVRVERTTLPAPASDEFFVADVIGCQVINQDGARLGVVDETFWNGAHDVMIVRDPAGTAAGAAERMIPLVPNFIRAVDVASRTVRVEWREDDDV
jgi:16S rRNA processing protein RimM